MLPHQLVTIAEAQLAAILAPTANTPPQHSPDPTLAANPWAAGSAAFGLGTAAVQAQVLQPQPSFEEMQHVATQVQQLLVAGHRLEALRQVACLHFFHATGHNPSLTKRPLCLKMHQ